MWNLFKINKKHQNDVRFSFMTGAIMKVSSFDLEQTFSQLKMTIIDVELPLLMGVTLLDLKAWKSIATSTNC